MTTGAEWGSNRLLKIREGNPPQLSLKKTKVRYYKYAAFISPDGVTVGVSQLGTGLRAYVERAMHCVRLYVS
jgi:hypothetical protein